jgi:hypothetical protein
MVIMGSRAQCARRLRKWPRTRGAQTVVVTLTGSRPFQSGAPVPFRTGQAQDWRLFCPSAVGTGM